MPRLRALTWLLLALLVAGGAVALEGKPKLGPDAVSLIAAPDYLRHAPALDGWRLAAFYVPQATSSACSVASVAMAVNYARGLPQGAEEPLVTQAALLERVGDPEWAAKGSRRCAPCSPPTRPRTATSCSSTSIRAC
jgi:hypothetical protein